MGFRLRIAPFVKVRVSTRGVRVGAGPRIARVHVGNGRPGLSSGVGRVGVYAPVGASRRKRSRKLAATGNSAESRKASRQDGWVPQSTYLDELEEFPSGDRSLRAEAAERELLVSARALVTRTQLISPSMLQTKLGIGPVLARRLLESLEAEGVVGRRRRGKPRRVLLQPNELEVDSRGVRWCRRCSSSLEGTSSHRASEGGFWCDACWLRECLGPAVTPGELSAARRFARLSFDSRDAGRPECHGSVLLHVDGRAIACTQCGDIGTFWHAHRSIRRCSPTVVTASSFGGIAPVPRCPRCEDQGLRTWRT